MREKNQTCPCHAPVLPAGAPDAVGQRGQCPEPCVCNRQHIHSLRARASWTVCECQGTDRSTASLFFSSWSTCEMSFFFSRCLYSLNHPSCYLPKQNPNWFDKLLALRLSKQIHTVPPWLLELPVLSAFTHWRPNAQALTFPSLLLPLTGINAVFTHPLYRNPF